MPSAPTANTSTVSDPMQTLRWPQKAWYAGIVALGFALLQNLDLVTFPLFGISYSPLVVTHMHWGALLMVAMVMSDRLYLRTALVTVLLGWLIRYLQTPDPEPSRIIAFTLLYCAMYYWTLACARWMGWPRPIDQRELRQSDLLPYALVAVLLFPLGWAVLHVIMNALLGNPDPLDIAGHAFLVLMFGIVNGCLPAVLFGTGREHLGKSLLNTRDMLVLIAYGCFLRGLLAWLSSLPAHVPDTLLELRFIFSIVLMGCIVRLHWRPGAMLVGMTGLLLPTVSEIPNFGTGGEAWRLLRMGLEMGALQLLLTLGMLMTRDTRDALQRLTDKSMHDALSGVPNVNALHRDVLARTRLPDAIGCLGIERLDAMMAGLGLAAQERLTTAIHQHLQPEIHAYTLSMGRFAAGQLAGRCAGPARTVRF